MLNLEAWGQSRLTENWLEGYEGGLRSTGVPREERMQLVAGSVGRLTAESYFAGYARGSETGYDAGMFEGQRAVSHSVAWIKFGPTAASRVSELVEDIFEPEWTAHLAVCVVTCGTATEFLAQVKEMTEGERP